MFSFDHSRLPPIYFGKGKKNLLPSLCESFGHQALLVSGSGFLKLSGLKDKIHKSLEDRGLTVYHASIEGEPEAAVIDAMCADFRHKNIDVVIGMGGGSVVDAAKAVSAMLLQNGSVSDYLEGVGTKQHNGKKVPYIAVPTTAGTGAELTKNAVIKGEQSNSFKKSLRHENFVPDRVIVDPELALDCPPHITAACGMDAFTQLLESYCSPKATPITDTLALGAMAYFVKSLPAVVSHEARNLAVRSHLAYGAMMSGYTLANAGLGIVHGMAGPIGGCLPIPHGVVCGTLLAKATELNIKALSERAPENINLLKLGNVGALFKPNLPTLRERLDALQVALNDWADTLPIYKLGHYGLTPQHAEELLPQFKNRNNPIQLNVAEKNELIMSRI